MGEAHEPCSCEHLRKWQGEINEIRPDKCKSQSLYQDLLHFFVISYEMVVCSLDFIIVCLERQTPEREVGGLKPTSAVMCP